MLSSISTNHSSKPLGLLLQNLGAPLSEASSERAGVYLSAFTARIQTALDHLLMVHPNGEVALVAHGGVCRAIIGRLLEMPMRTWLRLAQDYGCLNVIDWYELNPVLRILNFGLEW